MFWVSFFGFFFEGLFCDFWQFWFGWYVFVFVDEYCVFEGDDYFVGFGEVGCFEVDDVLVWLGGGFVFGEDFVLGVDGFVFEEWFGEVYFVLFEVYCVL